MKRKRVYRPAAVEEAEQAVVWYDAQRPGLGEEFVEDLEHTLQRIVNNPKWFAVAYRDIREAMLSRFPYCVYFRLRADVIVVLSVFHTARDPAIWQSRE